MGLAGCVIGHLAYWVLTLKKKKKVRGFWGMEVVKWSEKNLKSVTSELSPSHGSNDLLIGAALSRMENN